MYKRTLTTHLKELAKKYPVITVLGPRQSGKTTLVRAVFKNKPYVNLEDPNHREFAEVDPKSFMNRYPEGAVLDEVQRAPHLLSYIQVTVDEKDIKGMFILTGSHQTDLHSQVSQSLAGRTSILKLLPLSYEEMKKNDINDSIEDIILKGGYPRVYKENLPLDNAYSSYFETYVERDVRKIIQIKDVTSFERFIKLIASRIGQIVNYTSLAQDVGVSAVTIKEWISILEATYILVKVQPYFENFGKRLIKSPKIYFADTGLACFLLGIESKEQLLGDSLYGNLFENWIVLELIKARYNKAKDPKLYFYRDVQGHEVDLILQRGSKLFPIEIKSTKTFSKKLLSNLNYFHKEAAKKAGSGALIYSGELTEALGDYRIYSPETCHRLMEL